MLSKKTKKNFKKKLVKDIKIFPKKEKKKCRKIFATDIKIFLKNKDRNYLSI